MTSSTIKITVKRTTLAYLNVTKELNSKEVFIHATEEHSVRLMDATQKQYFQILHNSLITNNQIIKMCI